MANRKIYIFVKKPGSKTFDYKATTTQSKTCKEAKKKYLQAHPSLSPSRVKTAFTW